MGTIASRVKQERRKKEKLDAASPSAINEQEIGVESETLSLSSSSINDTVAVTWRPEDADNRRRYHAVESSDYIMPSDDKEQTRLEMQHQLLRYAFGSHVICPEARKLIKRRGTKVLDVGCANGCWMDSLFAGGHVNCQYYGVDITEDAFEFGTVCNAELIFGNVLERLPYDNNTFDYTHQRLLFLGIPKEKWPQVIKEVMRVTKPGGWIELVEACPGEVYDTGPAAEAFLAPIVSVLDKRGLDIYAGSNLVKYAAVVGGLANIGVKTVSIPLGWNGELGRLHAKDVKQWSLTVTPLMTKALGISNEEYLNLVEEVHAEWGQTKAFMNYHSNPHHMENCRLGTGGKEAQANHSSSSGFLAATESTAMGLEGPEEQRYAPPPGINLKRSILPPLVRAKFFITERWLRWHPNECSSESSCNQAEQARGGEETIEITRTEGYDETLDYSEEEEARVRLLIDTRLMPWILFSTFILNIDRTNLSNAIAGHLPKTLGFSTAVINNAGSMYSVIFSAAAILGSILGKRFGPHKFIPFLLGAS
ncbi:UNVERIFIED_CONTAM: hypothetical protein HDU68_011439 [Siphonaria sp. JEL0065]|nr:hypothetical protein HDU68_011439 [Siphonaria sp. JEL0065]